MSENEIETVVELSAEEIERLIHDLTIRNFFQIEIFKRLNLRDNNIEDFIKYSGIIRKYIDNPAYVDIRKQIANTKYQKAADLLMPLILQDEEHLKAA
jgi:hypothetical protein